MPNLFRLVFVTIFCLPLTCISQIGGNGIFKIANLPMSARVASLGGIVNAVFDNDPTITIQNPALLNKQMDRKFGINYLNHLNSVAFGSISYTKFLNKYNITASSGLLYINYGDINKRDELNSDLGITSPNELCLYASAAQNYKRLSYGGSVKLLYSQLDVYKSAATAVDAGLSYIDTANGFIGSVVVRNLGLQISSYNGIRENLPLDIQLGFSIKPKYAPLRLGIIIHDLQRFDYTYINTNKQVQTDFATGLPISQKVKTSEKIARHFIINGEFLVTKNFNIRLGYNHQIRKEMALDNAKGLVGYSAGVGFRVKRFHISYGRLGLSASGATNSFSIITNINDWL